MGNRGNRLSAPEKYLARRAERQAAAAIRLDHAVTIAAGVIGDPAAESLLSTDVATFAFALVEALETEGKRREEKTDDAIEDEWTEEGSFLRRGGRGPISPVKGTPVMDENPSEDITERGFLEKVAEIVLDEETRTRTRNHPADKRDFLLREAILFELRWRDENRGPE